MKPKRPISHLLPALLLIPCGDRADAALFMTASESGGDVVVVSTGSLNLNAWTSGIAGFITNNLDPSNAALVNGGPGVDTGDVYTDPLNFSAPSSFGTGGGRDADIGSGGTFGMFDLGAPGLFVPTGYVSGSALSGSMTFTGETLLSLGMTPGTYVWSWGTGPDADSLTFDVVPEPSSMALAALGSAMFIRRRRSV